MKDTLKDQIQEAIDQPLGTRARLAKALEAYRSTTRKHEVLDPHGTTNKDTLDEAMRIYKSFNKEHESIKEQSPTERP